MKKIKFTFLILFILLAGTASLSAAISYSPPAPKTGETVFFTLSPTSGSPTGAISWNFGDGTPAQSGTALTITHVYAAIGSYTVKASYATMSHFQVDQTTVTVIDPRQITFSPPQPKAGQALAFTALNYYSSCIRWDFGDATIKSGAAAESHAYANAGSYSVRAYEECGATYGAAVMVTVARADEKPPDEEPPPVTPGQPTLAVSIISLYFAGGKTDVSVAKDSAGLQALADLQMKGTGILQWQWLVDGMAIKADTLAASFSNKYTLDSGKIPGLPTAIPGRHQVTLRFLNPKTDFAIPVITYFVALRGPAPVIRRVTPTTLAPGAEYSLELEGAGLTPDTEIVFPAPLALLKKAVILSATAARATVFVPITAGNGMKTVGAWNEYGKSSGPGQVTIAPPKPATVPGQGTLTLDDSVKRPGQLQARIVTFTCPAGGESWFPGTPVAISYHFSWPVNRHYVQLYKDNTYLGPMHTNSNSYQPGQSITLNWRAGEIADPNTHPITNTFVPAGGGYRIAISLTNYEGDPMAFSNPFTILDIAPFFTRYNKIYYGPLPKPGDCPECLVLDLPGLHEEMVNFDDTLKAELFWKGKSVAELGRIGRGQGFAAKLQIKLGPEALAAVKGGKEFELRLFDDAGRQFHSQRTRLLPPPAPDPPQSHSVIFSSPTGSETWVTGKTHSIRYRLTKLAMDYQLCLLRNGKFIGYIMFYNNMQQTGYPPGEYIYPWQVGKVMMEDEVPFWAPCGSGYTICAGCCGSGPPPYGFSNEFTIGRDFSGLIKKLEKIGLFHLPQPGGCPACFVLDLEQLREELVKSDDTMAAGLYLKGKAVAELGRIGRGQGFAARLQIELGPEALATVKGGEEFELRLFDDAGRQIHSQRTRLVLLANPDLPPQSSGPPPGTKPTPPLQTNVPQPTNPAPPAVFCTDIAVTGMKATLVSTQLGDTSVDIPHDKVKIEVVLENLGNKTVPSDYMMDIFIKKNGEKVDGRGYPIFATSLGATGSRFVINDIVDSFPHGLATTYSVEVLPLYNECTTVNNQASLTIDEAQLHPKAKQVPDRGPDKTSLRSSKPPDIPVEPLPAPQPPFVVTTEMLTVTGKTPSVFTFSPVTVTTETLTVTGKKTPIPTFTPVNVTTETLTVTGKK